MSWLVYFVSDVTFLHQRKNAILDGCRSVRYKWVGGWTDGWMDWVWISLGGVSLLC